MLLISGYIRPKLIASATLTAIIPAANMLNAWPATITTYPCLIFTATQTPVYHGDNTYDIMDVSVNIDIFTKTSYEPAAIAVEAVFTSGTNLMLAFASPVADPSDGVYHYSMIFRGQVAASEVT